MAPGGFFKQVNTQREQHKKELELLESFAEKANSMLQSLSESSSQEREQLFGEISSSLKKAVLSLANLTILQYDSTLLEKYHRIIREVTQQIQSLHPELLNNTQSHSDERPIDSPERLRNFIATAHDTMEQIKESLDHGSFDKRALNKFDAQLQTAQQYFQAHPQAELSEFLADVETARKDLAHRISPAPKFK